jgi:integrase
VFHRRQFCAESAPIATKQTLIEDLQHRCRDDAQLSAARHRKLRDAVLKVAGRLTYDDVEAEFSKLAKHLDWPKSATLKDFRHLFATSLENAGVPESYRRFLMGHSPGRAAIVTYTHLNKLREHYHRAVDSELGALVEAISSRRNRNG